MAWFQFYAFLVLAALVAAFSAPAVASASTEQVDVVIPVTYTADNVDVSLRCKLEYEEIDGQVITNDTLYLEDGEEGSFTITYTVPGTYYCQIYQVKGSADGVAYDEHIINVAIYVTTDSEGKLYADVVLYEDGTDKLPSAYFINHEPTPTPTPTPEAGATTPTPTPTSEAIITSTETSVTTPTPEPSGAVVQTTGTTSVKTADETPSAEPYVVLMLLAAFAVLAVLIFRKEDVK